MPDGKPYGAGSAMDPTGMQGGDARRRRLLQVSQGFLNQGPGGGAGPRTSPSTYPDVRGFASTPVGRILLKNIMGRMGGAPGQQGAGPRPRGR